MQIARPFNVKKWIQDNRQLLKPPVGNQQLFHHNEEFLIMLVGGPNARRDFHSNSGEEIFYQIEGSIQLRIIEDGVPVTYTLDQGDMMLIPANMPHSPIRPEGSVGLVIERYRQNAEEDGFAWYCNNCGNKLHETREHITDIVNQLSEIMNRFANNDQLRTCNKCGEYLQLPSDKPAAPKQ
jgi:3-hydroxyanthranilate 3,4-dioxygenase